MEAVTRRWIRDRAMAMAFWDGVDVRTARTQYRMEDYEANTNKMC